MNIPSTFQHYRIRALLGEGDIAFVYQALNTLTGQEVALKVLRVDSPVPQARWYFENERAILAQLHHAHIPAFYESIDAESPGIALQFIDGKDGETVLAELPEGDFLNVGCVIRWGIQLADALAYLHNHTPPIAVRDLKPAHVMVDTLDRTWLVDYNLAKVLPASRFLADADAVGTQGFSAPEQYSGIVSPLVDIYSLGATLHYLLTRVNPRHTRRFIYAPPRSINPAIPKPVAQVVMKALAYDPEDRFQSMEEIREQLENLLTQP